MFQNSYNSIQFSKKCLPIFKGNSLGPQLQSQLLKQGYQQYQSKRMLAFYSQPFTRKSCGPKISYGIYFPATVARTPCGGDFDCGSSLNGPFTTAMDKDST